MPGSLLELLPLPAAPLLLPKETGVGRMTPSPGDGDPGSVEAGFQGRPTLRGSAPTRCLQPGGLAKEPGLGPPPKARPPPSLKGVVLRHPCPSSPTLGSQSALNKCLRMDQRHTKPGLGTRYRELRRWGCRVPQPPHVTLISGFVNCYLDFFSPWGTRVRCFGPRNGSCGVLGGRPSPALLSRHLQWS